MSDDVRNILQRLTVVFIGRNTDDDDDDDDVQ